ncbi:FAD-dependent oxidoreductase [Mucilaginibacter jinjuensis]|uniref:FAD-dependent oxidoreductase n=1 Tax=Mucilaginibacter jinjuensis TaxID=1176721 RepID=A0ABY7T157_9SPHI|nr:FAD-dependent oxidoreductase [Mucilaginibacter jinjuensis]WCT10155.1 FAD-dependent oxidoreductase [Mucilaginibacter jinjuensis]
MKNKASDKKTVPTPALRDGEHQSPWQTGISLTEDQEATINTSYDVLIVGAGITGITTALMLQKAGKQCVVADSYVAGFGTTGGTSAHLNTFADTTYAEAESAFGKEGAQLFADAINEGFDIINSNIKHYKIDCDYETKTGFVYAETDDEVKQLDDLYTGTQNVGVSINYTDDVPTPVEYQKAVALPDQAQFHPLKYLQAIQQQFIELGGVVLNYTQVTEFEQSGGLFKVATNNNPISARAIIYATHMPPGVNVFNFRCAPYRSYVLGVKLTDDKYPDALVYDMQEPYHYFRTHEIDGQKFLIAGGNDHKTGHEDAEKAFEDLEKYIRKYYNVSSVKYKWSSQYYVPVDGFPYIGQMPGEPQGVYCATGYNGNGMMLGSIAAKILSDLVIGDEGKYEKIFSPARIKPIDGFTEFVKENADVAYHFIADRFNIHETDSLKRLKPDSGKVVEVNGQKIAAYRDGTGKIHALSPVCTHAKCIVNWNQEEKSWDCPCHGARFDINGEVLTGPARKELQQINLGE